ncbi:MAG TPA: hypothetical protein PK504_11550 [Ferruginibacter sp.]|nr:hypothetical protein [Ferruginibacter sp.]HRE64298.1 hypothetical protein [Ferruginibacter sp.]
MNKSLIQAPEKYRHELLAWERSLDYHKQENAYLKMYLAELIDKYNEVDLVTTAEYFNNKFVFIDELILTLHQDIRLQSQMLKQHIGGEHLQDELILKLQVRLRNEMEKFVQENTALKNEFNNTISDTLNLS